MLAALIELLPIAVARLKLVFQQHASMDFVEQSLAARQALGGDDQVTDLAMKLKLLVRHVPIPTTIAWVPAHCGIDSNERADELADRGAITSGKKGADVDPSSDFTTSNFVPRIYDG